MEKFREPSGNFTLSGEWSTCILYRQNIRVGQGSDAVYKIAVPRDERSVECENVSDVCSCLCLMCELSRVPPCVNDVAKLLPCLAAAANHKHYSHHVFFLQSVCKQVVELCQPCLHFITSVVLRLSVTCCFLYTTHYYRSSKLIKRILNLVSNCVLMIVNMHSVISKVMCFFTNCIITSAVTTNGHGQVLHRWI